MITSLAVKNLTAFKRLDIGFSPNINIIIGENSTGKTHVLKSIFVLNLLNEIFEDTSNRKIPDKLMTSLAIGNTFEPKADTYSLFHDTSVSELELTMELANSARFSVRMSAIDDYSEILEHSGIGGTSSVYLPSKEMMFFLPDLLGFIDKYKARFDDTHTEITKKLILPDLKPEHLNPAAKSVLDKIEELVGGKFIVDSDSSIQFVENGDKRHANLMAEGFRKLGVLSRLIETGNLIPGESGPLLWDEPEVNLNPKLIKSLVEILIELTRAGQQIILVTHNFMLMKWFELYSERESEDSVLYHSLYRDVDTNEINVSSTNQYDEIVSNTMEDAFASLVDFDIETAMEKLSAKVN